MTERDRYLSNIPPTGRALSTEERASLVAEMAHTVERSHLFKSLDAEGHDKVIRSGYVCCFPEGQMIIRQGEPGDTMYLVLNGKVQVQTGLSKGGSVTLAELGNGACFGEVSLLTGRVRTANVTALQETSCVAFAAHRIHRVLEEYPAVKDLLQHLIEGRARNTIDKLIRSASTSSSPPPSV